MSPPCCTPRPSSVNNLTPEPRQLGHRNQAFAPPADRDRACDGDLSERGLAEREHVASDGGRVDSGLGVRHGDKGRVTTEGGGSRAGLDRLGDFATGLTQVGVQVDETRRDETPARVENGGTLRRVDRFLDRDNPAVSHEHLSPALARVVHERPAPHDDLARQCDRSPARHHIAPDPSRWNRTAMRTTTPFRTWRVTREAGMSATSGEISTPRIIGPGCMMRASPLSASARAREAVAPVVLVERRQQDLAEAL